MKKGNIIICCISILIVTGFISLLAYENNRKTFIKDGITYALTVDGVKQTSFPSKGMYRVDTECTNATCKWDYDAWKLYIEDITGDISCNVSFTTIAKTNFNDKIISLSGTVQGAGQLVHETFTNSAGVTVDTGYRYEGQDPNNYVWFNNELWRIIGVFGEESHGVASTNLIKIIRNIPLGGLAWDKSNINNWSASSLKSLLNTEYLNSTNGTNGDNCYGYSTTSKAKCDYTETGIKDEYRKMIKDVTWYLGGYSSASVTVEAIYGYERETAVYSGNPTSDTGKIGLMYASDYGYAVPASSCARTTNLIAYNNATCTLNNWLYGNGSYWTITPGASNSNYVFYVTYSGLESCYNAHDGYAARPVLYLESGVYVIDGNGSYSDPYIIGM